jgi:cell division protein FtsZ
MMGVGLASGENRAVEAATQAISSNLLESSIVGATRILVNVSGDTSLSMIETSEAVDAVTESADPDAIIIFGMTISPDLDDKMRVTVIATGFDETNPQTAMDFDNFGAANNIPAQAPSQPEIAQAPPRIRTQTQQSGFDENYVPDFLKRGF